ncbi:F-box/RNI-like superfamily protein [Tanacetum coccineum]
MILNPGEVMKHSSANNDETFIEEDFISKLPYALLTQILSLLPDADACRTSVLSKRWKDLWMFLPNLHVHICDWLRIVVQCGVQILVLKFCCDRNDWTPPEEYILDQSCWDFFKTCNTLVELTLEGEDLKLDVPKDHKVLFPSVKKISLVGIQYSGNDSFDNLITGCPVLEELCFTRQDDHLRRINVSSTSLKRLRIYACRASIVYRRCEVAIDAPNLEFLFIMDEVETDYSFTVKPLTLAVGAVYEVSEFDEVDAFDEVNHSNVQIFPNLVRLVIDIPDILNWRLLVVLLRNMPKLEHLTILNEDPSSCMNWNPPLHTPACLRFIRMKEIALLNWGSVTREEFAFMKFLLKHLSNLEKFTINVRENDHDRCEKLLNFFRGSNMCQIEFVPSL